MDEKRRGEIALALARIYIRKEPIRLNPSNIRRTLGNIAQSVATCGISKEEVYEFAEILLREAVDGIFPTKRK